VGLNGLAQHPELGRLALLAVAWVAYFAVHSVLASLAVKGWVARRRPSLVPAYRLAYNVLAVLLLAPVLALVHVSSGPPVWAWSGLGRWAADALALAALGGVLWSLRHYDGQEFLGLRQWHERRTSVLDQERLRISPLHRVVRHPWYTLSLVLVWTRDMDAAWLLSCVLVTLYFVVGLRLEEAKLLRYHGEVYAAYRRSVPALVPRPWRMLSRAQADALLSTAAGLPEPAGPPGRGPGGVVPRL
jgi:protein-S-isoprenylcysteine O-methyltransferase Ste14